MAYSRSGERKRVTARLKEDAAELGALLGPDGGGHLYICGDVRVGEGVKAVLRRDAGVDLEALASQGRLHEEVFGSFIKPSPAERGRAGDARKPGVAASAAPPPPPPPAGPLMKKVSMFSSENAKNFCPHTGREMPGYGRPSRREMPGYGPAPPAPRREMPGY